MQGEGHTAGNEKFLRSILESFPSPVFVVDGDVKVVFMNRAAVEFAGKEAGWASGRRGGEVVDCINVSPAGCGRSEACARCVIRNSVGEAVRGGRVDRRRARLRISNGDRTVEAFMLVTASPFLHEGRSLALLVIEDIGELVNLRGLLPICAWCKKIRDDENYWKKLEEYFSERLNLDFTHSICEECAEKAFAEEDQED